MDSNSNEPTALKAPAVPDSPTADLAIGTVPEDIRGDGWTGFRRRLFLQVLAETGRVDIACDYCKLSRQSAYSLRARDPVFAASWDAACELARAPLADALFERAMTGVTDTITKDGEVVAERHRFDSRLSIAVLNRLDKRSDQARAAGAPHMTLVAHWDEWLGLVGKDEEEAAGRSLIAGANPCQPCQLPLGDNPIGEAEGDSEEGQEIDLWSRCWFDENEDIWMTDFPPPDGFKGFEEGEWEECEYKRSCTPREAAILDMHEADARGEELAGDAELRDRWFALLGAEPEDEGDDGEENGDRP